LYKVPEHRDGKEDGSLAAVVGAGGCGRLTAFVAQKDSGLPVVKVGEPDPVGEIQNGDELTAACHRIQNSFAYCWFGGGLPNFSSELS
jgi:hypothetical protein